MKLKEHKITITLGVIGLLISLILFIDGNFMFLLLLTHPIITTLWIIIWKMITSIFQISYILENNTINIIASCIIFLIYYSIIGYFIDKAIKNKEKRKKILAILITSLIILNGIGFWLILSSKLGSLPV